MPDFKWGENIAKTDILDMLEGRISSLSRSR